MARVCRVNERTIHRWATGISCPRPRSCAAIAALAAAHHHAQAVRTELSYRHMIAGLTSAVLTEVMSVGVSFF